jgi:protein arginine kinase
MNKWYEENLSNNDIVISSRVSLLRNLMDYPFPMKLEPDRAAEMIDKVKDGFFKDRQMDFYTFKDLEHTDKCQLRYLIDSYLVSRRIKQYPRPKALICSKDEADSIRINDKDHINIVALAKGKQLDKAYESANRLDDLLNERLPYAYSHKYGYLTTSPANMGTGMRASYFLHLPFLESTGATKAISEELNKFGYVLRGVYGEENDIHGSIYQIYNQRTLGMSEDELMTSLNKITHQVVEQEMHLRSTEIKKNRDAYEDSIYKAYGILKYARSLTLKEAMDYLSNIRIGLCEHMIELDADKDFDIYRLMMASGSAMLDYKAGTVLSAAQRNHQRAGLIRASLPDLK